MRPGFRFCYDGILNCSELGEDGPRFSECLQFTILSVPTLFLFATAPIVVVRQKLKRPLPITRIKLFSRAALTPCLLISILVINMLQLMAAIYHARHSDVAVLDPLHFISLIGGAVALLLGTVYAERQRRLYQPRSEVLFTYSLLLLLSGIPRLWSLAVDHPPRTNLPMDAKIATIYLCSSAACVLLSLLLVTVQFVSPHTPENSMLKKKNDSAELWASVPSLWTFAWFTGTVLKAYRGCIQRPEDVSDIAPANEVEMNYRRFSANWAKVTRRFGTVRLEQTSSAGEQMDDVPLLRGSPAIPPFSEEVEKDCVVGISVRKSTSLPDSDGYGKPKPSNGRQIRKATNRNYGNDKDTKKPENIGEITEQTHREQAKLNRGWLLFLALWSTFGTEVLCAWICLLISNILPFASPLLLGLLVRFLNSAVAPAWHGYGIAVALLLVGLTQTVLDQRGFYGCLRTGVKIKSTLISAIYRKALKISSEARAKYTTGELTNFLSVDVNRIMESFMFSFFAWVAFVQFGFALYLLWSQLGVSTLAGVGCLLLLLPFNAICMWWTQKFQVSEMQWKDKRMKCLGEVIGAIRVLKLYAWEKAFEKKISEIRKHEVKQILGVASGWAVGSVLWNLAPYLILLVTFTTYTRNVIFSGDGNEMNTGELLNPERIFVSVSLFNLLRGPLVLLPWSMSVVIMAYVSIRRVCTLLLAPELDKKSVIRCELDRISDGTAVIEFKDASFSWSKSGPIVLKNINLRVPRGWLVAVVGNVGSGKSSLLSACLGDLVKRTGLVRLSGSVGYVPQTAWIQQMSLRANICFDIGPSNCQLATEQELWYRKVIDACALQTDIDQLPAGDMTEIGERGVNLSGGQKQRVSLARAVFQNCDTYLMDDPLSAVDAQVGRHLFEHVLGPRGLLHNKTRLLTTNSLHWLPEADWILVLSNDGRVKLSGTYQELVNNSEYLEIIKAANSSTQKGKHHSGRSDDPPDISSPVNQSNNDTQLLPSDSEMPQSGSYGSSPNIETTLRQRPQSTVWSSNESLASLGKKTIEEKGNFVSNEEVLQGHVSWAAYADYISARSTALTTLMLAIYFGFLCFRVFSSYWLRLFADDKEIMNAKEFLENATQVNETVRLDRAKEIGHLTTYYIVGYALIGVAQTALLLTSIILNVCTRMRAAKVVHRKLLHSVLCTAMPFFDHTPLGRILNRFSNDVDNVDHEIPAAFLDAIASFGNVMLSLALIIIALKPPGIGLAIVGPLLIVCFAILLAYLPSSRQARRLEPATRSPLLANFSETAASSLGVTVVRAFGRTTSFAKHLDRLVDQNAIYGLLRFTSNRWLDTMLNIFSRIMVFVTALVIVWFRDRFTPGLAGLIISFTFETAGGFTWMAMQYSQLETSAVSLERIREYSCLKEETNWNEGPASPPPDEWPSPCCEVVFNKATVKYPALGKRSNKDGFQSNWDTVGSDSKNPAQTVTALHSVDLALSGAPSKRRIGVVGRTGAGKSTLASSLFMLVDSTITEADRSTLPKGLSGCGPITVDGINLTELGLQEIRSRFSIIPQEPVLFSGTLRFNLDPFGACSDTELWAALEVAHLASWAHSPAIGLDYECGENGCNLSAGQRQLVCLARVCLSSGGRVRLLILDEATAAMDPTTDRLVMQTVVGDYFRDATVIIIAHRLETVMDTDMIVLMDHGKVVETGSPTALLADPNSRFTDLHRAWR